MLSAILEQDTEVVRSLLQPFSETHALTTQAHNDFFVDPITQFGSCDDGDFKAKKFSDPPPDRFTSTTTPSTTSKPASYDSSEQVIAHIVRDWTLLGEKLRKSTYQWCQTQLQLWAPTKQNPVLVPGAGLGRLAFDISKAGYSVEANEYSLVMASAAHAVLSKGVSGKVHPFATDYFVNEVNSETRYKSVVFPDWDTPHLVKTKRHVGSLSYTVGDFVELYSAPYAVNCYGAIVTCFFLDTATNVYEYLSVIHNLLKGGVIWINVGPLQWHSNAKIRPSIDELRMLIDSMGFNVKHWAVDKEPIPYRHDEIGPEVKSTKYEGYRPLRFVAIRSRGGPKLLQRPIQAMKVRLEPTVVTFPGSGNGGTSVASNFGSFSEYHQSSVVIEELKDEAEELL